jgi:hypothetical protein
MHHLEANSKKIATVAILVIGVLAISAVAQGTQTVMASSHHRSHGASAKINSSINNIVTANAFAVATNTNSITFNPTITFNPVFTPTNTNSNSNHNTLEQLLGPILVSDPYATVTVPRG